MRRLIVTEAMPEGRTEDRHSVRQDAAAAAMAAWAGVGAPSRKRAKRSWKPTLAKAIDEAKELLSKNGWSYAEPKHLVGLYAVLHEQVYGVAPDELVEAYPGAVSAAARLVRDEFEGKVYRAVEFLRWVWSRERAREKRRAPGEGAARLGWRFMFAGRALLTDWKVDQARAARSK